MSVDGLNLSVGSITNPSIILRRERDVRYENNMNQPPHNKKNTQSGGFKMSM